MILRRSILAFPLALAAACRRKSPRFPGYAFIANQEGGAIAIVDLEVFAVAKHIKLDAPPAQVTAGRRPSVYVLTPDNGTVHEIDTGQLKHSRALTIASKAVAMQLTSDEKSLLVLAREPRALISLGLESHRIEWKLSLQDEPVEFSITPDGKYAAISSASGVRLANLEQRGVSKPLGPAADFGAVRFLADGKTLIVANRSDRLLSLYDVPGGRLITHLPLSVKPENLCFNSDGGQLFVTGEGMDAVVVVYPFRTPEVAETVLAGHAPGAMAASNNFLFVASPESGDVSIINIPSRKVVAVVQVGSDPGFVAVTPDDQYALVLNRQSGDVAVIRVGAITPNRYKSAGLLTVIPVGSRPVNAAVRAI